MHQYNILNRELRSRYKIWRNVFVTIYVIMIFIDHGTSKKENEIFFVDL